MEKIFTCVNALVKNFVKASLIPRKLLLLRELRWKKTYFHETFGGGD